MRRIARSVFTEVYFWGCNPSFVVTDDGVVMIDTPQQPIDAVRWRERIHLPGHTKLQTAVHVPEEGVLLTGDNVYHECKTFIQEADPWEWLAALERIERCDVETIVPGHGEPCDRGYLTMQAEILRCWLDVVERFVDRGLTVEEALREPLDMPRIDPYPIGQRLFDFGDLDAMNVRNLHARILARRSGLDRGGLE